MASFVILHRGKLKGISPALRTEGKGKERIWEVPCYHGLRNCQLHFPSFLCLFGYLYDSKFLAASEIGWEGKAEHLSEHLPLSTDTGLRSGRCIHGHASLGWGCCDSCVLMGIMGTKLRRVRVDGVCSGTTAHCRPEHPWEELDGFQPSADPKWHSAFAGGWSGESTAASAWERSLWRMLNSCSEETTKQFLWGWVDMSLKTAWRKAWGVIFGD